ncbi:unnamed protein product [Pneumocystis jirovecii]|uniref:C2H2-type domain-containing protein n=1 Tax=Pneumocystis jirovecii TaxID=42068 RepID=L0P7Z3_PNEJI|nr:unnamed protein product [Pneumocystis jirovecii]
MSSKNDWNSSYTEREIHNLSLLRSYQDTTSISSDTSGSLPSTPKEELSIVTTCKWNGCYKDQGSFDNLIKHLYNIHIGNIKSIYICEWDNCPLKGITHMSRSSFIIHLKFHIEEKSFSCTIPECGKSFIHLNSLKKHMKIIHNLNFLCSSTFNSYIQNPYLQNQLITNKNIENFYLKNEDTHFDDKEFVQNNHDKLIEWSEDEVAMSFYDLSNFLKRKLLWIKEENQKLKKRLHRAQNKCKKYYIQKERKDKALAIIR